MFISWMLSGYFYFSSSRDFLKREHDVERNRNLSIAFCISWWAWTVCWTPNYVLMLSDLFRNVVFFRSLLWLSHFQIFEFVPKRDADALLAGKPVPCSYGFEIYTYY